MKTEEKLKEEIEKFKKFCIIKDIKINKITSNFQKKMNKVKETNKKIQARGNKRKEQAIKDHNQIKELQKLLYSKYPELKNKYNGFKAIARKRDNNSCLFCMRNVFEINPDNTIHHIIPVYLCGNNNPENLITICEECHQKIEDNYLQ